MSLYRSTESDVCYSTSCDGHKVLWLTEHMCCGACSSVEMYWAIAFLGLAALAATKAYVLRYTADEQVLQHRREHSSFLRALPSF